IRTNLQSVPALVPRSLASALLFVLPWIQICAGVFLILGLLTQWAAAVAAIVLVSIAGSKSMFADPLDVLFHHTLAFFGLALLLALHGGGEWSVYPNL